MKKIKILFVCLGNICRSPTAHALFQARVYAANLAHYIIVDSAGTGSWHIGLAPDKRAQKIALTYGYDMKHLQARQVTSEDFTKFDYILAMDKKNLDNLYAMQPKNSRCVIGLFLTESGNKKVDELIDPYYSDEKKFHDTLKLIEQAVDGLLKRIIKEHPFLPSNV